MKDKTHEEVFTWKAQAPVLVKVKGQDYNTQNNMLEITGKPF